MTYALVRKIGSITKYAKGGPYQKWFGNDWLVVDWENNGKRIKEFVDENGKQKSRPQNEQYYLTEGITYCSTGSKGASFRLMRNDHLFDSGGSSIFTLNKIDVYVLLATLNSNLAKYIINCLNPTVNTQVGDIGRIPIVLETSEEYDTICILAKQNVAICETKCGFSLIEYNFSQSPISSTVDIFTSLNIYYNTENALRNRACHSCASLYIYESRTGRNPPRKQRNVRPVALSLLAFMTPRTPRQSAYRRTAKIIVRY